MVVVTRQELRKRVLVSNVHRAQILDLLQRYGGDKAHKTYGKMSMHSCHFTHIAMVIWTKSTELDVPEQVLATGWRDILISYAKYSHDSAEIAGRKLLSQLVEHGSQLLEINVNKLIELLHPMDQIKLEGQYNG